MRTETESDSKVYERRKKVLKAGSWKMCISEAVAKQTKITCRFHLKFPETTQDGRYGKIGGTCNCGFSLELIVDEENLVIVTIQCEYVKGGTGK